MRGRVIQLDARLRAGGLTLVMLLPLLPGCTPQRKDSPLPPPTVAEVLERHTARLMSMPGVAGTAEGRCAGQPCIVVLVERLTPALRQAIPSELEGIPVEIRESGRIEAR
jgi:hypothetical protein